MSKRTRIILGTVAAAILVAGGYFSYAYTTKQAWPFQETAESNNTTVDGVDYSPPTEQEVQDSQDGKKNSEQQDGGATPSTVSVGIAFAGLDEQAGVIDIRAFTPDVIEGDGTCTATLAKGSLTVTQTSKAFIDASSSQCEPILIAASKFPEGGTWSLTATYTSSTSTGTSAPMNIEVTK